MQTHTAAHLELEALTKQVKHLRVFCITFVVAIFVMFLSAFKAKPSSPPDVVTSKSFVLVDNNGKTLATLGQVTNGYCPQGVSCTQLTLQTASGGGAANFVVIPPTSSLPRGAAIMTVGTNEAGIVAQFSDSTNVDFGEVIPNPPVGRGPLRHIYITETPTDGSRIAVCADTGTTLNCPFLHQ